MEPTPTPAIEVSDVILNNLPARFAKFVAGVHRYPAISVALAAHGFSPAVLADGFRLFNLAVGYVPTTAPADPVRTRALAALAEIDAWDEPNFRKIHGVLDLRFPDQSDFLFADHLVPAVGAASLRSVSTLVARIDALASAPSRAATRTQDRAALAALAAVKLDDAEWTRLKRLLADAAVLSESAAPSTTPLSDTAHRDALLALYMWVHQWTEIAHTALAKKGHRQAVGIAKRSRRTRSAQTGTLPATTPAEPRVSGVIPTPAAAAKSA